MEAKGMVTPESARQRMFPISAPPREAPVPVLPRPDVRPAPVFPEPEKPQHPENRRGLYARLARVLLAIAGVGGPAVNHHINYEPEITPPAIGRDIASIPGFYWDLGKGAVEDIQRLLGLKEATVPPTFDNNAERIRVGDNNITRITPEEANEQGLLTPTFDEETKTLTMISPFVIPQGSTASLDTSTYEVRGIKHNEPRETIPAGTQIVLPEGMHYRLVGGNSEWSIGWNGDPKLVYMITAFKYDPHTDTSILLSLNPPSPFPTELTVTPYEKLYPKGVIVQDSGTADYWNKLPISDGVKSIGTTTSNQTIVIHSSIFRGNGLDFTKEIKGVQLQWQQDNGKLLLLAPSN
jgi:hypothetical protein